MFQRVTLLLAGLMTLTILTAAAGQQASKKTRVPRVPAVASLRAQAPEDVAAAAFFDAYGSEPIQKGMDVQRGRGLSVPPAIGADAPDYLTFIRDFSCSFDAIVIGDGLLERVLLNRRETFLLSKYTIAVSRWISPTDGRSIVKVTIPGGEVEIGGKLTRATSSVHPVPNESYMFLLRRIPGTPNFSQVYRPINEQTNWAGAIRDRHLPAALTQASIGFEQVVNDIAAAASACEGRK